MQPGFIKQPLSVFSVTLDRYWLLTPAHANTIPKRSNEHHQHQPLTIIASAKQAMSCLGSPSSTCLIPIAVVPSHALQI